MGGIYSQGVESDPLMMNSKVVQVQRLIEDLVGDGDFRVLVLDYHQSGHKHTYPLRCLIQLAVFHVVSKEVCLLTAKASLDENYKDEYVETEDIALLQLVEPKTISLIQCGDHYGLPEGQILAHQVVLKHRRRLCKEPESVPRHDKKQHPVWGPNYAFYIEFLRKFKKTASRLCFEDSYLFKDLPDDSILRPNWLKAHQSFADSCLTISLPINKTKAAAKQ